MELRFFELYRSAEYIQLLAEGASVSFFITVSAGIFGFLLAFGLAGLRYFKVPIANMLAAAYVDFIRNTPLIVQMFFIAFGLPLLFGYVWPFWCHAVLDTAFDTVKRQGRIMRQPVIDMGCRMVTVCDW
jgi:polar amino acid transport system permease protein